jgi:hypothetical protein
MTASTPEIEPIPAEGLAWLHQSARVHGATYSQVLLHVLERIELLDKDSIEQSQSNRFSFEAVIKRLELLEAVQQHDTLLIGGPQDKLDRLIELDQRELMQQPTPEAAPVATDGPNDEAWREFIEQIQHAQHVAIREGECPLFDLVEMALALWREASEQQIPPTPKATPVATDEELLELAWDSDMERLDGERSTGGTVIEEGCWEAWDHQLLPFARAIYNLGRQHGAARARCPHIRSSDEGSAWCALAERTATPKPASPVAPVGALSWRGTLPNQPT